MATAAQIQSALADAAANDVSYADMATLLKRAIVNAIINGTGDIELPWQSVGSDGTSTARMAIDAAQRLLQWCQSQSGGGIIGQYVEFTERR